MQLNPIPPTNIDLEMALNEQNSNCWTKNVYRDVSQYFLSAGGLAGTGGMIYGIFSSNIPLAVFSGSLAAVSFLGCGRVFCLKPLYDFEQNIIRVNEQGKILHQNNLDLNKNLQELQEESKLLQEQHARENRTLNQLNITYEKTIAEMGKTIENLRLIEAKYSSLEQLYVKVKKSFLQATNELELFTKQKNKIPAVNLSLNKNAEDLEIQVKEFHSENEELESLLTKFEKYLLHLEKMLARITIEKEAMQRVADETKKIDESDDKYKEGAEKLAESVRHLQALNADFEARIKEMEETFQSILPLLKDIHPDIAEKLSLFLQS